MEKIIKASNRLRVKLYLTNKMKKKSLKKRNNWKVSNLNKYFLYVFRKYLTYSIKSQSFIKIFTKARNVFCTKGKCINVNNKKLIGFSNFDYLNVHFHGNFKAFNTRTTQLYQNKIDEGEKRNNFFIFL